jgi:hypothetical protein
MQTTQGNLLQSLRSVKEFLNENAARLGDVVTSGARVKLDQTIAALESHVAEQVGSVLAARGATERRRVLMTELVRDHMAPIARIAQADLPHIPEIEAFRLPRNNLSTERLAAAAHGMAQQAAPYADHFVKAGLPLDFIERLTAAADAMVQAVNDRAQSRGRRSGATKGLKATLTTARKLVQVMDAMVTSKLAGDPALLASWKQVKRVRRVAVRSQMPQPTAPAPGAPTPILTALPSGNPSGQRAG